LVGKACRKFQTWTIAGYLLAREFLEHPEHLNLLSFEDDPEILEWICRVKEVH
jgi:hypothetical protein